MMVSANMKLLFTCFSILFLIGCGESCDCLQHDIIESHVGRSVTLLCWIDSVDREAIVTYQKGNKDIEAENGRLKIEHDLHIDSVETRDDGEYRCFAPSGGVWCRCNATTLTVVGTPVFADGGTASLTAPVGGNVTFDTSVMFINSGDVFMKHVSLRRFTFSSESSQILTYFFSSSMLNLQEENFIVEQIGDQGYKVTLVGATVADSQQYSAEVTYLDVFMDQQSVTKLFQLSVTAATAAPPHTTSTLDSPMSYSSHVVSSSLTVTPSSTVVTESPLSSPFVSASMPPKKTDSTILIATLVPIILLIIFLLFILIGGLLVIIFIKCSRRSSRTIMAPVPLIPTDSNSYKQGAGSSGDPPDPLQSTINRPISFVEPDSHLSAKFDSKFNEEPEWNL